MYNVNCGSGCVSGRSSSPESSTSEPCELDDVVRIFGLGQRDLQRTTRMTTVSDLGARQLGVCMSGCHKFVAAADLLATGGDTDA